MLVYVLGFGLCLGAPPTYRVRRSQCRVQYKARGVDNGAVV